MTLKEYITAGYGAGTYKKTLILKEAKKLKAKAKNQMVFLEKCLAHNVLPKSFKIHAPLKSQNARRIVKKCRNDLLICAKNDAKKRFFISTQKALETKNELQTILNADDLATIVRVTDNAQEKMFRNAKNRMIAKFNELTNEPIIRRQPNTLANANALENSDALMNPITSTNPDTLVNPNTLVAQNLLDNVQETNQTVGPRC